MKRILLLLFALLNLSLVVGSGRVNFERVKRLKEFDEQWMKNAKHSVRTLNEPKFIPGSKARGFSVKTLEGTLTYPGPKLNESSLILFHSFNWNSAFLQCLWNCTDSLEGLVDYSPENVHYVFMSRSGTPAAAHEDVVWMRDRIERMAEKRHGKSSSERLLERCHFVMGPAVPKAEGGFWIPELLEDWSCEDHNCGINQVVFSSVDEFIRFTLPRLDARYDWLRSPVRILSDQLYGVVYAGSGCELSQEVNGSVALVESGSCSHYQKVSHMERSGAKAVLVMQDDTKEFEDMNCHGDECMLNADIPAAMIPRVDLKHFRHKFMRVQYVNRRSENFFAAIDQEGDLSEVGWFLHPSFRYLNWQADWFNFKQELKSNLSREATNLEVFNNKTVMQGYDGATVNYTFSNPSALKSFNVFELDMALSCQGTMDADCPHWDRTIQLFMTCDKVNGEVELGRWISPFRRRIGRWLTDISPLLGLLPEEDGNVCKFTFTGALGGEFWMPRLSLRFSHSDVDLRPVSTISWISGSFDFNKNYNSRFQPFRFYMDKSYKLVKIYSVITGHGSDENGCGEFCVTSHHFLVNKEHLYNETFFNAGTPMGCAEQTRQGVEPNEHGTWLYGRNGWCDGQEVDPWVVDVTDRLRPSKVNVLEYFGLFEGAQPDPKKPGAVMTLQAFVVFYK